MEKKGYFGNWGGAFIPEVLHQTFKELEEAVMNSDLTEIQEAEVLNGYLGERVRWSGVVSEVSVEGLVSVDIDGMASDVQFYLATDEAVRLSSGEQITFVGNV